MEVRRQTIEYWLMFMGLLFPFLYFGLRALVWDAFVWIAIIPGICYLYVLGVGPRFLGYRLNALDKIILLYVLYGVGMTGLAVLFIGYSTTSAGTAIVHYYAPGILYFIARSYTRSSVSNISKAIRIMWFLAVLLVVDVFLEFYVAKVNASPLAIPWLRWELQQLPFASQQVLNAVQFGRVGSILSSPKLTGTMVVAMFAFILPFFYVKKTKLMPASWARSLQFNPLLNLVILVSLVLSAFIVLNKSALLVGTIVLVAVTMWSRSLTRIALVAVLVIGGLVFYHDLLVGLVRAVFVERVHYSASGLERDKTVFQYVVNIGGLFDGYANTNVYNYFFGNLINSGGLQANLTTGPFGSELRGLVFPVSFGLGWAFIVTASGALMSWYSLVLIRTKQMSYLGLAFLAFLFVFLTDVHYTTIIRHGPLELLFVVAAILSSLREARGGTEAGEVWAPPNEAQGASTA